jgi:hypothetical protein
MKMTNGSKWSYLNAVIIIWAILMIIPVPVFSTGTYKFERMWPSLQQPWYFDRPYIVAVDKNGSVYVADPYSNLIQKFTSDGQFVTKWGTNGAADGQFNFPIGITVDSSGFIYIADYGNNRIQKFTSDGQFVTKWGTNGAADGQFNLPGGITVDSSGYVYVTDEGNHRVQKFTSDGQFVTKWGSYCSIDSGSGCIDPDDEGDLIAGDGQFNSPTGITIDSGGMVYVVDLSNNRIQKFTSDGVFVTKWGGGGYEDGKLSSPFGIAADSSGFVYVVDEGNNRIQKFTSDGQFVTKWGTYGAADGQFEFPKGIAIDGNGFAFVADTNNNRIQKFSLDGQFVARWVAWGYEDGKFKDPYCIAVDSNGFIYIADQDNNRIQKFNSAGQFVTKWGTYGPGDGQFSGVRGIAIDSDGYVYTTESANNYRVQKFTSDGVFVTKWGSEGSADGQFISPNYIAADSSGIYVVETNTHNPRIQKFTSNGQFVTKWGRLGFGDGQFGVPTGIAVDSSFVYVADSFLNRIQKFTSDGVFVTKWGTSGTGDGQFHGPFGIDFDSAGFLYVVDQVNNRIQKFNSAGQFAGKWGTKGSDPGQFNVPYDITIGPNGLIYVSDTKNNRIQAFRPVSVSSNNKAIVVAGGGPYPGNKLWEATQTAANFAYWTLLYQGFTKDSVYYLTSDTQLDLDNNGAPDDVDGDATATNLQNTITTWASGADNLFVYLVDHGGSGTFRMSETETLNAADLNSWLNAVQASISGKVVVIYDACESGSFLSALAGNNRILVTSTSAGESSYFVNQGSVSFSSFFWTNVFNGSNVKEAFDNAKSALNAAISAQTPLLNDGAGGTLAQNTYIGNGTIIAGNVPTIGSVSATTPAQSTATITANNVTDSDGIARVWAVLLPPNYAQGAANNSVNGLPSVDLMPTATANQYQADYDKFNIAGTYNIAIYAKDRIGNTSMPSTTTVTVGSPLRKRAIIVAGGSQTDMNWNGIQKGAQATYDALKFQGYSDNDIYFTSPVTFTTGIDGTSTLSNLQYAIETWGADSTYDMVMYMVGNGDTGTFQISGTETLSAAQLDGWLDSLQTHITGKVTVIYDASYSGAFNAALAGPNRILIASSGGRAYFLSDGDISFSNYFWKRILNGENVRDAFYHAKSAMEFSTDYMQTALIDDNGNGTGNESSDGTAAFNQTIGAGIRLAGNDPLIGSVVSDITLNGETSALIWADDVTTTGTLDSVWAVVTAPLGPGEESPVQTTVQMSDAGNNRYEGTTGNIFTSSGRYTVTVYAKDTDGNMSTVSQTTVYQSGLIDKYEEDDTYQQANVIFLNHPYAQQHNFDVSADEDWVKFYGLAGTIYTFSATNLGTHSDVKFELYNEAGATASPQSPIVQWDNAGTGVDELHDYTVTQDGIYYLKVTNSPQTVYGVDTGYDLDVYIPYVGTEMPGIITGYVYVSGSNPKVPIAGASVVTSNGRSAISGPTGFYSISNHNPGTWSISVSKSGYNTASGSVSVTSLTVTNKDLSLAASCSDGDGDGYGNPGSASCPNGSATDCNDNNAAIHPGAAEACDGADNDCDGLTDDSDPGVTGQGTWHPDTDGDGYGSTSMSISSCIESAGYIADNNDCDDSDEYIYPGGPEVRIIDPPMSYYWIYELQTAYNDALSGETIQGKAETYTGNLTLNQNKTVTIEGGYTGPNDCGFASVTGETTINGNVTLSNGKLNILNGKLRVQ